MLDLDVLVACLGGLCSHDHFYSPSTWSSLLESLYAKV